MAYDGNGNYVRIHNWTSDAANNLDINATEMDAEDNGFAAGLSNCVTRDGQGKMSADFLPSAVGYNLGSVALPWATLNGIPIASFTVPTQQGLGAILFPQTAAENTAAITPTNYARVASPIYDMSRYGITANSASNLGLVDNSAIVQSIFNMAKVTGGTLVFPYGDWSFYLDISGTANLPVVIEGNGSVFRPFKNNPAQSCVLFANNSGASVTSAGTANVPTAWSTTNVEVRNVSFVGELYSGGTPTGDVNCAVAFYGASAWFWRCNFSVGKVAGFYGMYTQYTEFYSCGFYSNNLATTTAGCILDSHGNSSGSNEVTFFRCYLQANSIALWMKGAIKVRCYGTNFQGNGTASNSATSIGVVVIDADGTGFSCVAPQIDGAWFEVNTAPHIFENAGSAVQGVRISKCLFNGGGSYTNSITTNYCSDWSITDCYTYATALTCTFNNPGGAAKLTFRGNNFAPVLNLASSSSWDLDVHYRGQFTGTLTGCTTSPNIAVIYTIEGDSVDIHLPNLVAVSNSTTCTMTGAPALIYPRSLQYGSAFLEDNTVGFAGNVDITTAGVIDLYKNGNSAGFTASGNKGIIGGVFRYPLFT